MDAYLVQRARGRANGANVHEVHNLCQLLLLTSELATRGDVESEQKAREIRKRLREEGAPDQG